MVLLIKVTIINELTRKYRIRTDTSRYYEQLKIIPPEAKIAEAKENMRHLNNMHDASEKLSVACLSDNMSLSECPTLDHPYPEIGEKL
ncbi:hypothetical protein MNBD_ALPHA03-442 [hydrothermal vent metagenome]|uniref:Uncharacterized protein n=1 Tax=hydrothermal vent metagenome TaxID=652676 RepID=A0A3B1AH87_9ZZZZ